MLVDEMGLGKTVQVVALVRALVRAGLCAARQALIVVQLSTLSTWRHEVKAWCPHISLLLYSGSVEDRKLILSTELNGEFDPENLSVCKFHAFARSHSTRLQLKTPLY